MIIRLLKMPPAIFILSFLLLTVGANAQTPGTISGTVKDSVGNAVPGATITNKQTKISAAADAAGKFVIKAQQGDELEISSVGFANANFIVGPQSSISINLYALSNSLNDVVVVGYGAVKKKDLTGSVALVNVSEANKNPSYDVAKILQGQVAGVSVHGSGEPGGYVQVKIRGISNFGDNSPLYIIDGVPVEAPFDFSPNDIESISILKDASAGAIYGSRAATGVVIITTKKGKGGAPKFTVNGYAGVQNVPKKISVLDREEYQKVVNAATDNAGLSLVPANDPSSPYFVSDINTDWQDVALKTGVIQNYNVGISGGSELFNYNASLDYFNQSGYQVGPQGYNRYSFNAGLNGRKGRFSYGININYMGSKKGNYSGTANHAVFGGTVTAMLTAIPTVGVYDSSKKGGYAGTDQTIHRAISANVVGLNKIVDDWSKRNRILLSGWAQFEIVKNLNYKIAASYDRTDWENYHYEPSFDMGYYYINTQYLYTNATGQPYTQLTEQTLTYNFVKGNHRLDLLAGYSFQKDYNQWLSGKSVGDGDLDFQTFSFAAAGSNAITQWKGTATNTGLFGRANYNFKDKYIVTANFRRDGSSKFAPSNRYGNFAGFAGAWNIYKEEWLHLPSQISSLKLRGGWGQLGSQKNLGYYDWQSYINSYANYNFANIFAAGGTTVSVTDPNLKWEVAQTSDIALDMGFLNERLTATVEYFNKTAKDIITSLPLPYSVGSIPNSIITNAASVKNTGVEVTLGYKKLSGKFTYNINANFSTLHNEVLKLGGTNNPIYGAGSKTVVGRSVGELFGYQTEGIFQTQGDIDNHAFQSTLTAPGDVIFKAQGADKNGDHNYIITDANDRTYLGTTIPKYYFGFNFSAGYANFDFSLFIQGSGGNKVFNGVYQALMTGQYGNQHTDELNYWTPSNTDTKVPRPIIGDPNGNNRFSDLFVEDGSYVRLQNAQIGYSLPSTSGIIQKQILSKLRFYVSGENLLTISKYKGYDPDFISDGLFSRGFDYGSFPNPRTILVGIQLGF